MKRQLTILAALGALAAGMIFSQTTTAAQAGRGPGKAVRALAKKRLVRALDLSATQKQQARTIFQSAKQTAQPLAHQLKQNREALDAAVQAGDSARIQQLSLDMGNLRGHVLAIRSDAMAKFYALLTPEQKTKATELRQRVKQRLGKQNGE